MNVQKEARKNIVIDLLAKGVNPKIIVYNIFGYTKKSNNWIMSFFQELFDNTLSYNEIIYHDWSSNFMGWLRFYFSETGF